MWQPLVQRKLKIGLLAKVYGLVSSFPMGINITEVLELNNMTIKREKHPIRHLTSLNMSQFPHLSKGVIDTHFIIIRRLNEIIQTIAST